MTARERNDQMAKVFGRLSVYCNGTAVTDKAHRLALRESYLDLWRLWRLRSTAEIDNLDAEVS